LIGLINVADKHVSYKKSEEAFNEIDLRILCAICREIAVAIENFELYKELNFLTITDPLTHIYNYRQFSVSLGYEIKRTLCNTKHDRHGRRCVNHGITFRVPQEAVTERCDLYKAQGKIVGRAALIYNHDYTIVSMYQSQYRGFVQYYVLAHNLGALNRLKWTMLTSMLKTLAKKHKTRVNQIVKRYKTTTQTPEGPRQCFEVKVEREGKKPMVARFGGIPLKRQRWAEIKDQPKTIYFGSTRTELVQRLLADTCEICGATSNCEVHHIRKLSDLKVKGRRARPQWQEIMAAIRRKTLVACRDCHVAIHAGKITLDKTSNG
jgi:hypothetical protein